MATLEQYLEALKTLQQQSAIESLEPGPAQQTEWRYGYVCGIRQGLRMAEELLNKELEEVEDDGTIPRRHSTHRRPTGTP
jgi:hypothetical protein